MSIERRIALVVTHGSALAFQAANAADVLREVHDKYGENMDVEDRNRMMEMAENLLSAAEHFLDQVEDGR